MSAERNESKAWQPPGPFVDTSFAKPSGKGVPMFSRMGMLTTVGSVEFQNPRKVKVDSTFEKERKAAALAA